ncbi:toxin-antitoxin system YwqK family antitoxin [Hymenobacter yonginensis]|uniref:Uncharacterized protein n=1 Tax=Hymenobacter yonginensis TaxID=748197 RepID=A0ABY7PU66_9BACT|nr:hypothetical protein [Hymenobacter yonginensis]WBO86399.1 hypothetical protein O9Z63_09080 [Hymenobacter yonginensis]
MKTLSTLFSVIVLFGCDNVESSIKELAETTQQNNSEDGGERDADLEAYSESADMGGVEQQEEDLPTRHLEEYYGDGPTVKRRYSLVNNKLHGVVYDYYRDGITELKSQYEHGARVGEWTRYDVYGDVSQIQEYYQDVLRTETNYKNGVVEEIVKMDENENTIEYFTNGNDPYTGSSDNGLLSGEVRYTILDHHSAREHDGIDGISNVKSLSREAVSKLHDLVEEFHQTNPDLPKVRFVRFKYTDAVARKVMIGKELIVGANNISHITYISDSNEIIGNQDL